MIYAAVGNSVSLSSVKCSMETTLSAVLCWRTFVQMQCSPSLDLSFTFMWQCSTVCSRSCIDARTHLAFHSLSCGNALPFVHVHALMLAHTRPFIHIQWTIVCSRSCGDALHHLTVVSRSQLLQCWEYQKDRLYMLILSSDLNVYVCANKYCHTVFSRSSLRWNFGLSSILRLELLNTSEL